MVKKWEKRIEIIYQDREGISARKQLYKVLDIGKHVLALENGESLGVVGVPDEVRDRGGLMRVDLHIISGFCPLSCMKKRGLSVVCKQGSAIIQSVFLKGNSGPQLLPAMSLKLQRKPLPGLS